MSLPIAILAGGLATRLHPLTECLPKSLVDIEGKPFAVHQIELLRRHGVTDITFLVGHMGEMVRAALGDGSKWGVRLRYVFDGAQPLGTGGAIRQALPELSDPFFMLYGDGYLECDYAAIAHAFLASGKHGLVTVSRNEDRYDPSNIVYADGRIVRYDKQDRTPEMRHIDYGLAAFWKSTFSGRAEGAVFDLNAVYQDLIAHDDLAGFQVPTLPYEIGSVQGLEETRAHLAKVTPA